MPDPQPLNLEAGTGFRSVPDRRPRVPEPLPVKLVAIEDVTLPATAGLEHELDAFYVGLLQFAKETSRDGPIYRADNFLLRFELVEGLVVRDHYRPLQIEVPSLAETERKLIDAEIEYIRQRSLSPGLEALVLMDPAGNWIELIELRTIM
jgi:hypothetical protein